MNSEHEVSQREAVLRRLRRMLEGQRSRFRNYLTILETQQRAADSDDIDVLEQQVELETSVLEQILETQKTIAPLEGMYRELSGGSRFPADISGMQRGLTDMRTRIAEHNTRNRALLSRKIDHLRSQVASLHVPNRHTSPYATIGSGSMVDIHG